MAGGVSANKLGSAAEHHHDHSHDHLDHEAAVAGDDHDHEAVVTALDDYEDRQGRSQALSGYGADQSEFFKLLTPETR